MEGLNEVSEKVNKEIIKYCYEQLNTLKKDVIKKNGIPINLFLELMYDCSTSNYVYTKDYTLSEVDYRRIYSYAKNMEIILEEFITGQRELLAIDDDGNFIFNKQRNLIE